MDQRFPDLSWSIPSTAHVFLPHQTHLNQIINLLVETATVAVSEIAYSLE